MPSKPTGGTGGRQDLRHISLTVPTPFQGWKPRVQGCPKAAAVSYETARTRTAKHQEEGGTTYRKLPGSGSGGKGEGNRVFSTHPCTKPQVRLEKSKARGPPVSAVGLIEQGTFQRHSASKMCRDGYTAVPWAQPRAARCLTHIICCLSGQGISQLMENFDMSNFIGFVQLGLKPNSTEALGWP